MEKKIFYGLGLISLLFGGLFLANQTNAASDIMEIMFAPARSFEKIIDLGTTKNAVGDEVFRQSTSVGLAENLGKGCSVNGKSISDGELNSQIKTVNYGGDVRSFCSDILGGDYDTAAMNTQKNAPLIVRISKFLLRITIVLSITMVIYNGIMWIVESSKGAEVKNAKDNLIYILGGVLLALMSLGLVNLISSISISSLN